MSSTSNQIQITHTPQRGDLDNHKTHSPSLQHYTPQVRTPSDFAGVQNTLTVNESTITRSK